MEINEKKLKEILNDQREEYQNYLSVLDESFDSKVKAIAEQYASIKGTLDSHTEILDSHTKEITSIKGTLDFHTEMIVSMKENIEIMKVDIAFIKGGLKKKVDLEEFEALEKRVVLLEAKSK